MKRPSFSWSRPVWILAGLLVAYYAFPLEWTGASAAGSSL